MPVLKNTRHEKFAQELAKGKTADEAYVSAGYKENRHNAARLNTNEHIRARVEELTQKGAEKAEVDVARVLQELSRIGFSDLRKMFTPDGALLTPDEWPDEVAAAVSSVEVVTKPLGEKDEDGRRIVEHIHKIRLWDKNSALDKIAKHLGMFVERHEHSGPGGGPINTKSEPAIDLSRLTDEELAAYRLLASASERNREGN